ncbi:hypothetical protein [Sporosarcina sp. Te-1]|uniref:hypothetical protein n=1 Tax=Sporosarcina sp. Te-1 TaxID=2818390 RepID=UPI001A9E2E45|nr:hypothetical protein [Sporosarcina sp. Te-1]QTD39932.1 hypothetical protein J3U78_13970 [Sporosarcina sp. Te-1]
MKRILLLLLAICLLGACSTEKDKEKETAQAGTENAQSSPLQDKPEEEIKKEQAEPDETTESDDIGKFSIPTVQVPSPYNEEGNMAKEHTMEEYMELIEKQGGIVRFEMDDYPVRAIDNDKVRNITNLGDAYIDISENAAYQIPKSEIPVVYEWFLSVQPEDLKGTPASEYRTWEEATNLERGIMQMVYLTAPSLNNLGYIIENDEYDHPALQIIQQDFFQLGSPSVLIPAPQTATDMTMFDLMLKMKYQWEQVGKFENPAENRAEFEKLYKELRSETNNLFVRINYVLTQTY